MTPSQARPRWARRVVLPGAALLVLAAVWTLLWYRAAGLAETTVGAWIEREAKVGRVYRCTERTVGGYPFRIEQRCKDPVIELRMFEPPLEIAGLEILAVAQVYQPTHIIAEVSGPVSIKAGGSRLAVANWQLAQASLRGLPSAPERVSIVLDGPRIERPDAGGSEVLAAADRAEFHIRLASASLHSHPVFDFALRLVNATAPAAGVYGARPLDAEITSVLRGLKDLDPKPLTARLKEWQAAGGRLEVSDAQVRQGNAVATAKGGIGLSASGRLEGALNITMAGFEDVVQGLVRGGERTKSQAGMLAGLGLAFLGKPAEINGKRAVTVMLRFSDGAVYFGPIPLGQVPPLY